MKDAALWVNDAILFGTALLVSCYVIATNKLVRSSQEQVRASQEQVESQSRPAIVVKEAGNQFELVNIGNGPALEIEWRLKERGTAPVFAESQNPIAALSYLESRQTKFIAQQSISLVKGELHCVYRSLSGRRYLSVSTFTDKETFE